MALTDLFIRDKYSGSIHRIGDDPHDSLYVDEDGTVHYYNLQNGDGCTGYRSLNRTTLGEKYKGTGKFKGRENEYIEGYEFVPCEYGEITEDKNNDDRV